MPPMTKAQRKRVSKEMRKHAEAMGLFHIRDDVFAIPETPFKIDLSATDPKKILLAVYLKAARQGEREGRREVQKEFCGVLGIELPA